MKNLCRNGDHYWVYAHVTPSFDAHGRIIGYHSNRRSADRKALPAVETLYAELRRVESEQTSRLAASAAGLTHLNALLTAGGHTYDEYVWSL